MREVGIELGQARPQLLTEALLADATHLVTMGCGEACLVAPKWSPRMDWPLEDPKGKPIERVRAIRDEARSLVLQLLRREGWDR